MTTVVAPEGHRPGLEQEPGERRSSKKRGAFAVLTTVTAIAVGVALVSVGVAWQQPGPGVTDPTVAATATTAATVTTEDSGLVSSAAATTNLTDVSAIAASAMDSVVTVNVTIDLRGPGELTGSGSGVIIDSDGTVVTNAHVVSDATSLTVTLTDGTTVDATVVGIDEMHDVAVLRVDATGLSPIEIGSTEGLVVGNPVIAIGNPLGLEGGPSVSTGIVSAIGRVLDEGSVSITGVIQTDAAITEGSSGGALLDSEGRLIGVTTAVGVSSVGVEGIGFAIPIETVMSVAAQLISA